MQLDPVSTARRALALLDLTELGDAATADDVTALCRKAHGAHGAIAAVCVWPRHVAHAAGAARHRRADRHGRQLPEWRRVDRRGRRADRAGPRRRCRRDRPRAPLPCVRWPATDAHGRMVDAVRADGARATATSLKVILETGELRRPRPRSALRPQLAIARRRLHQDVHRQDTGERHPRRHRGDARRDPRPRPGRGPQAERRHPHPRRRRGLPRPGRQDDGRRRGRRRPRSASAPAGC